MIVTDENITNAGIMSNIFTKVWRFVLLRRQKFHDTTMMVSVIGEKMIDKRINAIARIRKKILKGNVETRKNVSQQPGVVTSSTSGNWRQVPVE